MNEFVCSHFLPTLGALLPLLQVGVGVETGALVLRSPRIVGPVPPAQRQKLCTTWWIEDEEKKIWYFPFSEVTSAGNLPLRFLNLVCLTFFRPPPPPST